MPKRSDLKTILVLGAGPIVIGQACEFDYSGVQACKALREEGFRVVLVNSNPATIMTDPDAAEATYIEPIRWQSVARIIEVERPDAILPTMGGQTALNCSLDLVRHGVLDAFDVEMIGATAAAIDKAEDRELFGNAMRSIGLETVRGDLAHSLQEAQSIADQLGFPVIVRPSFTLGGSGGGIAGTPDELTEICQRGLDASPTGELLIEECILGWKEYELEVVRDRNDNCIIVCSIENLDPVGIHTGDSITVAPAQTLTDKEFQTMRDASIAVLREIGVDTGGSNVQFGVNPIDGRQVIIEMNPRVSRSSALASKATGFPIAKVAAKLAVGFTLDELGNDITGGATPASFEPSIDYVVTKIPRFDFEKFPSADASLTTQMKSVGEVMAIGRTFMESFHKALRSMEIGKVGLDSETQADVTMDHSALKKSLQIPGARRIWCVADALRWGISIDEIHQLSGIDPWFLSQISRLVETEAQISKTNFTEVTANLVRAWKRQGFSDARLAVLLKQEENAVRKMRQGWDVRPVYKRVDSCAGEFVTPSGYLYSSYEDECEAEPDDRSKIMILGGGPNRIGQGIEFDYCCVHAAMALREDGFETIMVNCNPETVSTDYDSADRLYFEPVTLEDVLEIVAVEQPDGVIVQYGGQTPLKLAGALEAAGVRIIGTSAASIHRAEDREQFQALLRELDLQQPPNRIARDEVEAVVLAEEISYPLIVRPSYVLGGRAMEVVHDENELTAYFRNTFRVSHV
ncbi:MAG TPA: carbamoyl-phosphate synthase large subunit, partial [Gammaproteobacteria bacterium]|nr:carbamoyl-phosphate synthase large subunit [Gammaproteobacteria bacterium]